MSEKRKPASVVSAIRRIRVNLIQISWILLPWKDSFNKGIVGGIVQPNHIDHCDAKLFIMSLPAWESGLPIVFCECASCKVTPRNDQVIFASQRDRFPSRHFIS